MCDGDINPYFEAGGYKHLWGDNIYFDVMSDIITAIDMILDDEFDIDKIDGYSLKRILFHKSRKEI